MVLRVMGLLLSTLVALAPAAAQNAQQLPPEARLRTSSFVLTEGIRGGIVPATRHRQVVLGYDWNRRTFRAVERRLERGDATRPARSVVLAADIDPEAFGRFVLGVAEIGLTRLPTEDPPAGCDLYGRDVGIRYSWCGEVWHNQANGGCTVLGSAVQPTDDERRRFDAVIEHFESTFAGLDMQPASALDLFTPRAWPAREMRVMNKICSHLDEIGVVDDVDLRRVEIEQTAPGRLEATIPWLADQDRLRPNRPPAAPTSPCVIGAAYDDGWRVALVRAERPTFARPEANARRAAFVEATPDLTRVESELVRAGWVDAGMTEAMIVASIGEPDARRSSGGEVRLTYRNRRIERPAIGSLVLRLVDGRLRVD